MPDAAASAVLHAVRNEQAGFTAAGMPVEGALGLEAGKTRGKITSGLAAGFV